MLRYAPYRFVKQLFVLERGTNDPRPIVAISDGSKREYVVQGNEGVYLPLSTTRGYQSAINSLKATPFDPKTTSICNLIGNSAVIEAVNTLGMSVAKNIKTSDD